MSNNTIYRIARYKLVTIDDIELVINSTLPEYQRKINSSNIHFNTNAKCVGESPHEFFMIRSVEKFII